MMQQSNDNNEDIEDENYQDTTDHVLLNKFNDFDDEPPLLYLVMNTLSRVQIVSQFDLGFVTTFSNLSSKI